MYLQRGSICGVFWTEGFLRDMIIFKYVFDIVQGENREIMSSYPKKIVNLCMSF